MKHQKTEMLPLWLEYPWMSQCSIGWRMGAGEDYRYKLFDWYDALPEEERRAWDEKFPQPKFWLDLEKEEDSDESRCFSNENHFVVFWERDGKPRYSVDTLKERRKKGEPMSFLFFWGHHPAADGRITQSCLSQWWKSDFRIDTDEYCCMEQYMMAEKARLFGDEENLEKIMASADPKTIKSLGRKVRNFDADVWDRYKYSIVLNGNYQKFIQNPKLLNYLFSTGEQVLVEASPLDTVWGIGMSRTTPGVEDPGNWNGQNLLGFALTEVREELRRVCKNAPESFWR